MSVQSAQANLSLHNLGQVRVSLPPYGEQREITEYLEDQLQRIDTTTRASQNELGLLREYRSRLVTEVVTGKLDVKVAARNLPQDFAEDDFMADLGGAIGDDNEFLVEEGLGVEDPVHDD
jgi:type I restriction enzyme S subunit